MTAETHSAKCIHRCYWFLESSGTLSDRVYTKASTRRVCLNIYHLKSNGFSLNIDSSALWKAAISAAFVFLRCNPSQPSELLLEILGKNFSTDMHTGSLLSIISGIGQY